MRYVRDLTELLRTDEEVMVALALARQMNLSDCWIGAGFIRNRVWDSLDPEARPRQPNDVDVIFHDARLPPSRDRDIEAAFDHAHPSLPWSVKNQAHMHRVAGAAAPFVDSAHAVAHWTETATAVAARVAADGQIMILAPFGLEDLFHLLVVPTPWSRAHPAAYRRRLHQKGWQQRWPSVKIERI